MKRDKQTPEINYMHTDGTMHCFNCHKVHPTDMKCPGEPSACTPECGEWFYPHRRPSKKGDPNVTKIKHLLKVEESEGWDYFFGKRDSCCPGDDFAKVYNLALDDFESALLNPDYVKDMEDMRAEELDEALEDITLDKHD